MKRVDRDDVRIVSFEQGKLCAEMLGCAFSEVSAKDGMLGIDEFVFDAVRQVRKERIEKR